MRALLLHSTGCTAAGALSWQQMTVLANAFKSASSGSNNSSSSSSSSSSSRVLLSEAAEVLLKVSTGASVLPFPWQASPPNPLPQQYCVWMETPCDVPRALAEAVILQEC